jgi:hypothetical protein
MFNKFRAYPKGDEFMKKVEPPIVELELKHKVEGGKIVPIITVKEVNS